MKYTFTKEENNFNSLWHVYCKDYFGTVATLVSLVRQSIPKNKVKKMIFEVLEDIENNLSEMQANYIIIKKAETTKRK